MNQILKDLIGIGLCVIALTTIIFVGVAASPTDSELRTALRRLFDTSNSPPASIQATNGNFSTLAITGASTLGALSLTNGQTVNGLVCATNGAFTIKGTNSSGDGVTMTITLSNNLVRSIVVN